MIALKQGIHSGGGRTGEFLDISEKQGLQGFADGMNSRDAFGPKTPGQREDSMINQRSKDIRLEASGILALSLEARTPTMCQLLCGLFSQKVLPYKSSW